MSGWIRDLRAIYSFDEDDEPIDPMWMPVLSGLKIERRSMRVEGLYRQATQRPTVLVRALTLKERMKASTQLWLHGEPHDDSDNLLTMSMAQRLFVTALPWLAGVWLIVALALNSPLAGCVLTFAVWVLFEMCVRAILHQRMLLECCVREVELTETELRVLMEPCTRFAWTNEMRVRLGEPARFGLRARAERDGFELYLHRPGMASEPIPERIELETARQLERIFFESGLQAWGFEPFLCKLSEEEIALIERSMRTASAQARRLEKIRAGYE